MSPGSRQTLRPEPEAGEEARGGRARVARMRSVWRRVSCNLSCMCSVRGPVEVRAPAYGRPRRGAGRAPPARAVGSGNRTRRAPLRLTFRNDPA
jgi:hypothetical protein